MMKMRHSGPTDLLSDVSGSSYVEALVTLTITALMAVGGLALVEVSVAGNVGSERFSRASLLALEKIEELRNLDFTDPGLAPTGTGCPNAPNSFRPDPAESLEGGTYTRYLCVSDLGSAPIRAKQIHVFVDYLASRSPKTVTMSTILARIEPWEE